MSLQPTPPGWPRMSASVFYRDPRAAIDWLRDAFGFEVRLKVEGDAGEIVHSELTYGDAMVMVGQAARPGEPAPPGRAAKARQSSPLDLDGRVTQSLCLFVDDVDAHCAQARSRGAAIHSEPATVDYGEDYWSDRSYGAYDPEGHAWWFMRRVREEKPRRAPIVRP